MSNENRGPRNLDRLFQTMTGYVTQKKLGHSFASGSVVNVPDKFCTVCGFIWGSAPPEAEMKSYICGMCNEKLTEGQTAIVCGNRYAFISNSEKLADLKGRVVKVEPATMDALEREYASQVKQKPNEPERKKNVG